MKKKDKKQKKEIEQEPKKAINNSHVETLSENKIVELVDLANNSLMKSDFDRAINYSEKVIRLAITSNLDHLIEEQQQFLIKIANKVQENFFISEINEAVNNIEKIYTALVEAKQFSQAHDILETFKSHYQDKIDLDSIPLIKELMMKDLRDGIKDKLE